jgi:hypothetical protein
MTTLRILVAIAITGAACGSTSTSTTPSPNWQVHTTAQLGESCNVITGTDVVTCQQAFICLDSSSGHLITAGSSGIGSCVTPPGELHDADASAFISLMEAAGIVSSHQQYGDYWTASAISCQQTNGTTCTVGGFALDANRSDTMRNLLAKAESNGAELVHDDAAHTVSAPQAICAIGPYDASIDGDKFTYCIFAVGN